MERKQFEKVSQELARYANKECFIIVQFGAAHAIHFKDVELPGKRQD